MQLILDEMQRVYVNMQPIYQDMQNRNVNLQQIFVVIKCFC